MSKSSVLYKTIFGEDMVKESYSMVPHSPVSSRFGKKYCSKCGLIYLNNKFSRRSVDKGCQSEYHPDYKRMRKLTRPEGM